MVRLKSAAISVLLIALVMTSVWQQIWIHRLTEQAEDLRSHVALSPPKQIDPVRRETATAPPTDQFRELLRLRGEVGVLRRELAEAVARNKSLVNSSTEETVLNEHSKRLALTTALVAQEQKIEEAKRRTQDLAAALNIPDPLINDQTTEGPASYLPYFQAKRELQERQRFAVVLRLKLAAAQIDQASGKVSGLTIDTPGP